MRSPFVGITMGDAAGIGPEILCKSLANDDCYENGRPFVLGDSRILEDIIRKCDLPLTIHEIKSPDEGIYQKGTIDLIDYKNVDLDTWKYGELSESCGRAAVQYTLDACHMCMDGTIDAMVSSPLNKAAMRLAGYHYEGVTQIIGEETKSPNYGMVLLLGNMKVLMYSNHCSLEDACKAVKKDKVLDKIRLVDNGLKTIFGYENPSIAVSALNPHCGEGGLFGRQEIDELAPAITEALKEGINAIGPVPGDTIFVEAKNGAYDAVIAMFHDQANLAMKLLGFGNVVTLLVGVPIIRTSTGHGTAFNIAGQNIANAENLHKAILEAEKIAAKRISDREGK